MKVKDIVGKVRVLLYRNEEYDPMTDIEGLPNIDNLKAEELINELLAPAMDKIAVLAPAWMLGGAVVEAGDEGAGTPDDGQPGAAAVAWDNTSDPYASVADVDDSVLRLVMVKLPGWLMPVMNFTSFDDALYAQYRSEYKGIRPSKRFPAVAVGPAWNGDGLRIEAYPKMYKTSAQKSIVRYVKKFDASGMDMDSEVQIDTRCLNSLLYMMASLWYVSTGDKERADMMEREALGMINITTPTEQTS